MDPRVTEWLHLLFRWLHIIAGIMWIGDSLLFNWLDRHLLPPERAQDAAGDRIEGELWMVHSGGFYQVEKKLVAPERLPKVLHWFKWEAGFTWISGFLLLVVLFYIGGALLVDRSVSNIGHGAAVGLCLGLLVGGWVVYDLMVRSPLAKSGELFAALGFLLVGGVAYGLFHTLSGRAAFIHVGALLGTLMAANVWMVIIPAQRHLVDATREGRAPNPEYGKQAKQRSKHNNYMTFPLLFIMISNHFPGTYGHPQGWLVLLCLMLAGAGLRHFINTGDRSPALLLSVIGVVLLGGVFYSVLAVAPPAAPETGQQTPQNAVSAAPAGPPHIGGPASPPAGSTAVGTLRGTAQFAGTAPTRAPVQLPPGCAEAHKGPVLDDAVLVRDGRVKNVVVSISGAAETPLPAEGLPEVTIDQRGCIYNPRVVSLRVGQRLTFLNSDPVVHNVHGEARGNQPFNDIMTSAGTRLTKTFSKPEEAVHMKCDIHPWMSAYASVFAHPYFAVTNEQGEFTLRNLPAGEYTVEAWHEVFGKRTQKVTIAAAGEASATFTFEAK